MSNLNGDSILGYLQSAQRRDVPKGGTGMRSTREVADRLGFSLAAARRELRRLSERGLVDELDGLSTGIEWIITSDGAATRTGE